jgi:hypothetical protein
VLEKALKKAGKRAAALMESHEEAAPGYNRRKYSARDSRRL